MEHSIEFSYKYEPQRQTNGPTELQNWAYTNSLGVNLMIRVYLIFRVRICN